MRSIWNEERSDEARRAVTALRLLRLVPSGPPLSKSLGLCRGFFVSNEAPKLDGTMTNGQDAHLYYAVARRVEYRDVWNKPAKRVDQMRSIWNEERSDEARRAVTALRLLRLIPSGPPLFRSLGTMPGLFCI